MIITKKLFDDLSYEAVKSSILRVNYDLRNSDCVQSRRMLNALEPGTQLPIHRHLKTSKICLILRGAAEEIFYDDSGKEKERFLLKSNSDCVGIQIPAGVWHRIGMQQVLKIREWPPKPMPSSRCRMKWILVCLGVSARFLHGFCTVSKRAKGANRCKIGQRVQKLESQNLRCIAEK